MVATDRIVGFATVLVTGQSGELEDLFVDPDGSGAASPRHWHSTPPPMQDSKG
jgi:hypothetical protein